MRRTQTIILLLAATVTPAFAQSGQLTPPAGAPAETGKPLEQIEPRIALNQTNTPGFTGVLFAISQPGSYYLTEDIQAVPNGSAIRTTTNGDVTIDLNGFTISSNTTLQNVINIGNPSGQTVTIKNGTIRGGRVGISSLAGLTKIEDMNITGTQFEAIELLENNAVVRRCNISNVTNDALCGLNNVTVEDCTFDNIGREAIDIDDNGRIRDVTITNSRTAVTIGNNCHITSLLVDTVGVAESSAFNGLNIGEDCRISNSLIRNNIGTGTALSLGRNTAAREVSVIGSGGVGIRLITSASATSCFVDNVGSTGILASGFNSIRDCDVEVLDASVSDAMSLGSDTRVDGCRTFGDIVGGQNCVITRNTVVGNISAGITSIFPVNQVTNGNSNFEY